MEIKNDYPTEVISLPSDGFLYPSDNILSSGQVELKYMTAREEDILTSKNLITKGIVLEKLLESIIAKPEVQLDSLLLGDKNAIFIATRIMGYGAKYEVSITCPKCGVASMKTVDLSTLQKKEIDFSQLTKGKNEFAFTLPASKKAVVCKFLTHGDEKAIDAELAGLKKLMKEQKTTVEPEISTRLKYVIQSIDGNFDKTLIRKFVDGMLSLDSKAVRDKIVELSPDINTQIDFLCNDTIDCNYEGRITMPVGVSFFWPFR
jgi:hypothetical protein